MSEAANLSMLEFLQWISSRRRTYSEAMNAWQSHCPRLTIWEDAVIDGYIQLNRGDAICDPEVVLTPRGEALLNRSDGRRDESGAPFSFLKSAASKIIRPKP